MVKVSDFAAIDPLALILPTSAYIAITEKNHPHVPKVADIREATKGLSNQERAFVLSKARALTAFAKAVEEALD
ncbi:MAG TPA: hypothetical protein VG937_10295 [Polyangiaceae bacterium]|nr:hypothetical protein [Polyangiaceae bacterium]